MVNYLKEDYISSQILHVVDDYRESLNEGSKLSFIEFFKFQI